ncbi:MAG: hypothetical protein EP330_03170 [Deltaproteobacteria bacterium]|nr:MAG: hypothetical protein EP330_03170 [Deltaproteobacteria bacterium]
MDFIGALAGQLGLDHHQAKALAGAVVGGVKTQLADEDEAAAAELDAAVPELGEWSSVADSLLSQAAPSKPAGGGLGGVLGGLAGAAAGGGLVGEAFEAVAGTEAKQAAQVVALLDRFGLDKSHAALVAPLAVTFLKERLPAGTFDKALLIAPLLLGVTPEDGKPGGLGGMLGGLLG